MKAIEDLTVTADGLRHYPKSQNAIRLICDLLDKAVKFIMPNCCDLIDPDKFNATDYALLKMPYPLTVLEAPWVKESEISIPTELMVIPSTKRIALLIESDQPFIKGVPDIDGKLIENQEGVLLISLYHAEGKWQCHCGGVFLPYGIDPETLEHDPSSVVSRHSKAYVESGLASENNVRIASTPVILLPELYQLFVNEIGHEKTIADLLDNSRDEMLMTLQACAVMNCENIESEDLEVPPKLQKSRIKSGKLPLHEYKILGIGQEFYRLPAPNSGRTKNAPRMHRRRGHVRRYADGKTTWVRHSIVNAGAKGSVDKSYKVIGKKA